MGVTAVWDNDRKTVIRYDLVGDWTWAELHRCVQEVYAMMDSVDHEVNVISNLRGSTTIPRGLVDEVRVIADGLHPNHGVTVYVGVADVFQPFASAFERIYPASAARYPMQFARTVEEARALLRDREEAAGKSDVSATDGG